MVPSDLTMTGPEQVTDVRTAGARPSGTTTPWLFSADIELRQGERRTLTYGYVWHPDQLAQVVTWLQGQAVVAIDLETGGLFVEDNIATLQLGVLGHVSGIDAWVIDVRGCSPEALAPIFAVLEGREVTKLGQNLSFEYRFLRHHYGLMLRKVADTQLAELIIRAGLLTPKKKRGTGPATGESREAYKHSSMNALMQRYAGLSVDKDTDLRTSFYTTPCGEHSARQVIYAASDVIYPFIIAQGQKVVIRERGLQNVIKLEMECLPVIQEMEYRGLGIDAKAWRLLWQEALVERAKAVRTLDDLLRPCTVQADLFDTAAAQARPIYPKKNTELNYGSSEQVRWAIKAYCTATDWPIEIVSTKAALTKLKERYGATWLANAEAKGRTVTVDQVPASLIPEDQYCILLEADKDTLILAKVRGQLPAELVDALLRFSKYDQRVTGFGNEWLHKNINKQTGRIHPTIHQALTNTGRTSTQPNLQNIPNDQRYRRCFVPAPGFKFVIADYSQQEPRLTAQMSKDPTYITTYRNQDDLYVAVAGNMLGTRPDKKTEEGALQRQLFKAIVLAMAYRSGVPKLRDQLTLGMAEAILAGKFPLPTMDFAQEMHRAFFDAHPELRAYQDACSTNADPKNKQAPRFYDAFVGDFVTYVRAPCGRLRLFPPDATNTYTEAANAPIQGGSASMTKLASCYIQRLIDDRGWNDLAYLVNMVHDEIVCEVHESIVEEFAPLMQALMVKAGDHYCQEVPIVAEFPKGTNGIVDAWIKEA